MALMFVALCLQLWGTFLERNQKPQTKSPAGHCIEVADIAPSDSTDHPLGNDGIFYALGEQKKSKGQGGDDSTEHKNPGSIPSLGIQVEVSSPPPECLPADCLLDRTTTPVVSVAGAKPDVNITIRLQNHAIAPTHYALQADLSQCGPRSWSLEAKTKRVDKWETLIEHRHDTSIQKPGRANTWSLLHNSNDANANREAVTKPYSWFRIRTYFGQANAASARRQEERSLRIAGLELWGDLFTVDAAGTKKVGTYLPRHVFGTSGLLYGLGVHGGQLVPHGDAPSATPMEQLLQYANPALAKGCVAVTSSALEKQSAEAFTLVGREPVSVLTREDPVAFVAVDLLTYRIRPTFYGLRHYSASDEGCRCRLFWFLFYLYCGGWRE